MLKKIFASLCILILLIGCRPVSIDDETGRKYSILSYRGAPSLSLLCLLNEEYDIKTTISVDTFRRAFSDAKFDILVAPVNVGAEECLNEGKYKLLAIVAYGNSYLVSTEENYSRGQVGCYGQNTVVGKMIDYFSGTDLRNYDLIWYDSMSELEEALINGDIKAAVIDEISFNKINDIEGIELYKIVDLQEDFEYETRYSRYPEFGLFVKNEVSEKDQNNLVAFAKKIKNSINTYKNDKTTFNNVLVSTDVSKLGFDDYKLIRESYNYCGLDFVNAASHYDELVALLDICEVEIDETVIIK